MVKSKATGISDPTNGGKTSIEFSFPYVAKIEVTGIADIIFHRWNCDTIEAQSKAAKGSKAKKTDDIESYVYRNDDSELCIPGEYLRQSIINAAKFRQDPRSPRKSAMDLFKAGVLCLTPLASLGITEWHYEHRCRAMIQRQGITRIRPAVKAGWQATFEMQCNLPEYISKDVLQEVCANAGRLIGLADFRPTYGRFQITHFEAGVHS